jgi:hypothetical protein
MSERLQHKFIEGYVKRAAEYGISLKDLKKQAAEDGPFSIQQAAGAAADEDKLKALVYNRKNHLGHYLLNPFVGGPLTEGLTRMSRRYNTGTSGKGGWARDAGGALPAYTSDKAQERALIQKLLEEKLNSVDTGYGADKGLK